MKFGEIFEVNKRREDGAWVTEGFNDLPGIKLKVRGEGCAAQHARVREIWDAASEEERKAPDFEDRIRKQVMLEVMLVDWRIDDRAYDLAAAAEALEVAVFREAVRYATLVVARDGKASLEADTKTDRGSQVADHLGAPPKLPGHPPPIR